MNDLKILSWNVNGIRAIHKKGFVDFVKEEAPDILCIQETKAHKDQLPEALLEIEGYSSYFAEARRKGYSGVAIYTKKEPVEVKYGFGFPEFDEEGRTIEADFGDFVLLNVYFPNGKASRERLAYKMAFYKKFLEHIDSLKATGRRVIFCGDVNTAHERIDLANPDSNSKVSGFLPQERAWIDDLITHGYVDTFRKFDKGPDNYTWWDYKTRARDRNVGWRIDYFFVSENLLPLLKSAKILSETMGSDHCPIEIVITG